jgi:hypothetical protein
MARFRASLVVFLVRSGVTESFAGRPSDVAYEFQWRRFIDLIYSMDMESKHGFIDDYL